MPPELRCPYCHDALGSDAGDVATCGGCGAVHHVACLIEAGRCSATGCGAQTVRVGEATVSLSALMAAYPDLDAPAPAPPRRTGRTWLVLVLGVVLAGLAGAAAVARGVDPVPVAGLVGAFLALLGAGVFVFRHAPVPTPTRPGALEFDPITGMWGASGFPLGSLHAPQAAAEAALGEGPAPRAAPAPRPAGPCPEACPHCGEPLAADDDEDEPLLTCYHCGGDLVDLGGRYLPARQREG